MDAPKLLEDFFAKKSEIAFNKVVKKETMIINHEHVTSYIEDITSLPIAAFLFRLKEHPNSSLIKTDNLTQAGRISACNTEICDAFRRADYTGLTLSEIGRLLHNDGIERTVCAEQKYGENVKGAYQLGLTFFKDKLWYLSAVGYYFNSLEDSKKNSWMARALLRDPLYAHIFTEAQSEPVCINDYLTDVSASTEKRRATSIFAFCDIIVSQVNAEGNNIIYPITRK